ncbi:MAG: orotate phosphoribosyltransferase [Brevinema sp.]
MINKIIAQALLDTKAVKLNVENHFTYASGIKSPIYCDNRFLLGFPDVRNMIVRAFLDHPEIKNADVIAGTSTAGIPWASMIADHLQKPLAYVRSEAKSHGTSKTVEGAEVTGKKTVIIEDLISTGGSSKKVLDNLIDAGAEVNAIVAIFSYQFPDIAKIFGETKVITLSDFTALIETAEEHQILSPEHCDIARTWNAAPHNWKN